MTFQKKKVMGWEWYLPLFIPLKFPALYGPFGTLLHLAPMLRPKDLRDKPLTDDELRTTLADALYQAWDEDLKGPSLDGLAVMAEIGEPMFQNAFDDFENLQVVLPQQFMLPPAPTPSRAEASVPFPLCSAAMALTPLCEGWPPRSFKIPQYVAYWTAIGRRNLYHFRLLGMSRTALEAYKCRKKTDAEGDRVTGMTKESMSQSSKARTTLAVPPRSD